MDREIKNKNQARLRLVKSDALDLCNPCNLTAASPLGSVVLPVSISLTEEASRPISPPISRSVMPIDRRSLMRDAHVLMTPKIRHTVDASQRLAVTAFRENSGMPKLLGMPDHRNTIGERVRFWREARGCSRKELAKKVGYSPSGLSDLELGRSTASEKLHLIAAELRLNPHYLEKGRGEPEAGYPQDAPPKPEEWPFPTVPPAKIRKFDRIERAYMETQLIKAINDIESERRNKSG